MLHLIWNVAEFLIKKERGIEVVPVQNKLSDFDLKNKKWQVGFIIGGVMRPMVTYQEVVGGDHTEQ